MSDKIKSQLRTLREVEPDDLLELEAAAELKALSEEITYHDRLYHDDHSPEISDAKYDSLKRRNKRIEQLFLDIVRGDSPSKSVGYRASNVFHKIQHNVPMLSLDNVFEDKGVSDFRNRIRKHLKLDRHRKIEIVAEPKIDGVSASLFYKKGRLIRGASRGDGVVGEDVTKNIDTIQEIPQRLYSGNSQNYDIPDIMEVRGEVYMEKEDFKA
ncbi:MAG: NAD-dependent DNA ligase LigA, partial [Proteobacteria bacterium]|nr:NAD-dependent DNA ligase LigA [Pseudomonadota bacterium]